MNTLSKYAYLLDTDNLIYENKIFIDLLWYIAKNKYNGENKPRGIVTIDKNGKPVLSVKSYNIRNAGIMIQQIFYWYNHAITRGKGETTFKYNDNGKDVNVIKMDFEDWWNSVRLTDKEITSANKLLIDTGLIKIHKMRIKTKNENVFKPSNCYEIVEEELLKYLNKIVEINEEIYKEKVTNNRINALERVQKSREKQLSTKLSTLNSVTPVTDETLETGTCDSNNKEQSTLSTEKKLEDDSVTPVTDVTIVTPVTDVTIVTPVIDVTIVTPVKGVANKSNTLSDTLSNTLSEKEKSTLSENEIINIFYEVIEKEMTPLSFNTWIKHNFKEIKIYENEIIIKVLYEMSIELINESYLALIKNVFEEIIGSKRNIMLLLN